MKLTPLEVKQKNFSRVWRGLDRREVEEFLALVSEEMEDLARENLEMKNRLASQEKDIDEYRQREQALKETLVTAQKMAEEVKRVAEKDAQILLGNASLEGERVVDDALKRRATLLNEVYELKRQKVQAETTLRHTLELHLSLLDTVKEYEEEQSLREAPPDVSFLSHKSSESEPAPEEPHES